MEFRKAVKSRAKLRAALFGPSGSGKTYSALAVASGMGTRIALIDSERSSASKYADRFTFDTLDLENKTIEEYVAAIQAAGGAGYEVLIVDSLSHGWQQLQEDVEKIAKARYGGNYWSAWSEGTPMQRRLVDAILSFPGHVIATMRSKTEWDTVKDERTGKAKPVRIGLSPEQGKGIEYEFDLLLELSTDHVGNVIKDRTGKFQDRFIDKPGKDFGSQLVAWLNEGAPEIAQRTPDNLEKRMRALDKELGEIMTSSVGAVAAFGQVERDSAREARAGIKKINEDGAAKLTEIVQTYRARLDALIMAWKAAGSPTPRPAILEPELTVGQEESA